MSKSYCISFQPLEPFFFAGEKSFGFGKKKKKNYNNYYIVSEKTPSQTTILGTLRYLVLQQNNLLSSIGKRNLAIEEKQNEFVGENSFRMEPGENGNQFGKIQTISPVFLKDKNGDRYVAVPRNQDSEDDALHFLGIENEEYMLLDGSNTLELKTLSKINLKELGNLDYAFVNLSNHKWIKSSEIFKSVVQVGILKNSTKDGFYKKEYMTFQKDTGFRFCVYVELDDDLHLENTIAYMGQGKSPFYVEIVEEENELKQDIQDAWKDKAANTFYYALSDICVDEDALNQCCHLIIDTVHTFRNLERVKDASNYLKSYNQSKLYHLIGAGSVFFVKDDKAFNLLINKSELQVAGFNKVLKIGE